LILKTETETSEENEASTDRRRGSKPIKDVNCSKISV
jgi:hypothetical protein